jgi:glutaredoxin
MKVTVYSQPDCPPCEWTKDFLARNGIVFTVKDVRADAVAREELLAMGFRSTPVTVIDGTAVAGFDQSRLMELLSRK